MVSPTWNGVPLSADDPRIVEVLEEAPAVLKAALGAGSLTGLGPETLLHAVEAASWLERYSGAVRHTLVPAAKVSGASWAELGRAMGVSRATAQHRFKQETDDWEEALMARTAPHAWETVAPLAPTTLPTHFHPDDTEFARHAEMPAWIYTGELKLAIQYICATHTDVKVWSDDGVHYVMSDSVSESGVTSHTSTAADSEEDAWRAHIGGALVSGQPYADQAEAGESLADLKVRKAG